MSEEEKERVARGQEKTIPLAERIEEGTAHHEPVKVYFIDGKEHTVEVYALSSRQFRQATKESDLSPREMFEDASELKQNLQLLNEKSSKSWDFFHKITATAVKNPPNILDLLMPGGEATIALKSIEMSQPPKPAKPSPSTSS
jgi:hypothetical protein